MISLACIVSTIYVVVCVVHDVPGRHAPCRRDRRRGQLALKVHFVKFLFFGGGEGQLFSFFTVYRGHGIM